MMSDVMVYSSNDIAAHGCPHCGCVKGYTFLDTDLYNIHICNNCCRRSIAMKTITSKVLDHPAKGCGNCQDKCLTVVDRGRYETPGCFCVGGDTAERNCIVIKTPCKKIARDAVLTIRQGAFYDEEGYVVVGADDKSVASLERLMFLIGQYKAISTDIVARARRVSSIIPGRAMAG